MCVFVRAWAPLFYHTLIRVWGHACVCWDCAVCWPLAPTLALYRPTVQLPHHRSHSRPVLNSRLTVNNAHYVTLGVPVSWKRTTSGTPVWVENCAVGFNVAAMYYVGLNTLPVSDYFSFYVRLENAQFFQVLYESIRLRKTVSPDGSSARLIQFVWRSAWPPVQRCSSCHRCSRTGPLGWHTPSQSQFCPCFRILKDQKTSYVTLLLKGFRSNSRKKKQMRHRLWGTLVWTM